MMMEGWPIDLWLLNFRSSHLEDLITADIFFSPLFLSSPVPDGPRAEGCDKPHLRSASGQDQAAGNLLQRLSDPLQLRGRGNYLYEEHL